VESEFDTLHDPACILADFPGITGLAEALPKLTHVYITVVTVVPSQHEPVAAQSGFLLAASSYKWTSGG
jgi:hypothetical protein